MSLTDYGVPLTPVTSFNYMGRFIAAEEDDNWPAVVRNLWSARQKWAQLTCVLIREVSDARTLGKIYLAVVELVMIYGSDTWVLTPRMKRVLGGFHHRVARKLTGRQPLRGQGR